MKGFIESVFAFGLFFLVLVLIVGGIGASIKFLVELVLFLI